MTGNKVNYAKRTESIIEENTRKSLVPSLLLQVCCAPCSSHCLEYLREYFRVTVFYYNPNITDEAEFTKRKEEEIRLIGELNRQVEMQDFTGMHSTGQAHRIEIMTCPHDAQKYEEAVRGLEQCPEGGDRCTVCFRLRLRETARAAAEGGFDYFTTTLTISPLKNADRLNTIGEAAGREFGVEFLPSDFKKKDGYKRSVELSGMFGLYRQDYCGCRFSKEESIRRKAGEGNSTCSSLAAY